MKICDRVWHLRAAAWLDKTATSYSGMALSVVTGDILFLAVSDWLAGALFYTALAATDADYAVDIWNGEEWSPVLPEFAFEATVGGAGYTWKQAYDFNGHGVAYWGRNPDVWRVGTSTNAVAGAGGFPVDTISPPTAGITKYWVRITFSSVTGALTLDKVFPLFYNTYASANHVAQFMGWRGFNDFTTPEGAIVRHAIRAAEDWLDNYCRKSWRIRGAFREGYDFNPYGFLLRNRPVLFVNRLGLWQGTHHETMVQGRGGGGQGDYFLDQYRNMVYFMLPSFRLRYYSFLLSRYIRQPASVIVDYVYGTDFETHRQAQTVTHIVLRTVGADLVRNADDTGLSSSGLDVLSKAEKVESWTQVAMDRADELREVFMTGLGMGGW